MLEFCPLISESLPEISFPFLQLCNPRKGRFSCTKLLGKATKPDQCLAIPNSDLLPHMRILLQGREPSLAAVQGIDHDLSPLWLRWKRWLRKLSKLDCTWCDFSEGRAHSSSQQDYLWKSSVIARSLNKMLTIAASKHHQFPVRKYESGRSTCQLWKCFPYLWESCSNSELEVKVFFLTPVTSKT